MVTHDTFIGTYRANIAAAQGAQLWAEVRIVPGGGYQLWFVVRGRGYTPLETQSLAEAIRRFE